MALVGNLVILPSWADFFRPNWLALVLLYWCIYFPERVGSINGWSWGTLSDAAKGTLLGQQGLSLALLAYLAGTYHQLMRNLPLWRQIGGVLPLLLIDQFIMTAIDALIGYPPLNYARLGSVLGGLVFWPWIVLLLRELCRGWRLIELQTEEEP